MRKKVLIAIYIISILFTLKLLYSFTLNNVLISKYEKGEYNTNQAEKLTYFNFPQSYVAYYNYGNVLYQNGEYEKAINNYELALNGGVSKDKRCNIRINYALAICKTVQIDEKDQESIKNGIKIYETAINVLTEDGCANKNDNNGHNSKAEKLKKDIQKEINRLKKLQNDQSSDNSEENDEDNSNNSQKNTETIEQKIQNIKAEATKDQRETQSMYESYNKKFKEFDEKNW